MSRIPPGPMRDEASGAHPHVDLEITGMTCASCVRHVEQALAKVERRRRQPRSTWPQSRRAWTLEGHGRPPKASPRPSAMPAMRLALIERERNALDLAAERVSAGETDIRRRAAQLAVGAVLSGVTLLLSYAIRLLALVAVPSTERVALPVWLWVGWKFHRGALRAARHGSANMDTLVSLGSSVAFVYSALALFLLPGRQTFFEVAALIVTLISVGKLLEVVARGRASAAIEALAGLQPRSAHLLARAARSDDWKQATPVEVPVDRIHVGDVVLIRPGERVPTDGVIIDGEGAVDESMLTGESVPALKTAGKCQQSARPSTGMRRSCCAQPGWARRRSLRISSPSSRGRRPRRRRCSDLPIACRPSSCPRSC